MIHSSVLFSRPSLQSTNGDVEGDETAVGTDEGHDVAEPIEGFCIGDHLLRRHGEDAIGRQEATGHGLVE